MRSKRILLAIVLVAAMSFINPPTAWVSYGAAQYSAAGSITAVNNYNAFYSALNSAVKANKTKISLKVANYNKTIYSLPLTLNKIMEANKAQKYIITGYKLNSSVKGKTAQLDISLTYGSADIVANSYDEYCGALKQAMQSLKDNVRVKINNPASDTLDINKAAARAVDENGDIFYLDSSSGEWSKAAGGNTGIMTVKLKYKYSKADISAVRKLLDSRADAIVKAAVKPGMSDYEKELALHDYTVNYYLVAGGNDSQGGVSGEIFTPQGVLMKDTGIYISYANIMQLELNKAGVGSMVIDGRGGEWNLVKLDGEYYHLDARLDSSMGADGKYVVTHEYFNLTDAEMARDHQWEKDKYPACTGDKFGYNTQTNSTANNAEEFYTAFKNALDKQLQSVSIRVKDYDEKKYDVGYILDKITDDHPELDFVEGASWSVNEDQGVINISLKYGFSTDQIADMRKQLLDKAAEVVKRVIKPDMTDYEKELALHDYIINNARYDEENEEKNTVPLEDHEAYGILVKGLGVCDGYAEGMKVLCDMAGLECIVVRGDATGTYGKLDNNDWSGHAWNIVRIDGQYYQLDVTWDDCTLENGDQVLPHSYFNLTDAEMAKEHKWDKTEYPVCSSTEANYFAKSGRMFKTYIEAYNFVLNSMQNKDIVIEFKAGDYSASRYDINNMMSGIFKSYRRIRISSGSWISNDVLGIVEISMGY